MAAIKRFTIWALILQIGLEKDDELIDIIKASINSSDLSNRISNRYKVALDPQQCKELIQDAKWTHLQNRAMAELLASGDCIDLSACERTVQGDYIIAKAFQVDKDYCDAKSEEWILSVGMHKETRKLYASTTPKFYQNAMFKCIWLR